MVNAERVSGCEDTVVVRLNSSYGLSALTLAPSKRFLRTLRK